MLSQLIQRQVPIGSNVSFSMKDGREVRGILIELGRNHVTLECDKGPVTILLEMIGAWQIVEDVSQSTDSTAPPDNTNETSGPVLNPILSVPLDDPPITTPTLQYLHQMPDPAIDRKLLEIEVRFQTQLQGASIQLKEPDFIFPVVEFKGKQSADAQQIWNRIKDKFSYAERINEIGMKFGRIQPLANEFKSLVERFSNSSAAKRHLAYFYWLLGNRQESMELYKSVAMTSKDVWDWHNLAVLSLATGQEQLACYSLEQFFNRASLTEFPQAWNLFTRLIIQHSNFRGLAALIKSKGRSFSSDESVVLLETTIYVFIISNHKDVATQLAQKWLTKISATDLLTEACSHFDREPNEDYKALVSELDTQVNKKLPPKNAPNQPQGYIFSYKADRNFGFLNGRDGQDYFFHLSAISDEDLFELIRALKPGQKIPVFFEPAQGPKGPLALGVILYRTVEDMFRRATDYANDGEYPKAIYQIKRVLEIDPDYPNAQESYEKWREYSRVSKVPKGPGQYARAKRVQLIEKDLVRTAQLLGEAIRQGDNVESAVKDLAALLDQQGKPEEAIEVLAKNRKKMLDQQSVDNMLIGFYQNARQHEKSIALLQQRLERSSTGGKKAQILWQIANSYLKNDDYLNAERNFKLVLGLQSDNKAAQRNIAICLFKRGQYDESQKLLEKILSTFPDAESANLLEAIKQAKAGQHSRIDEIIIETSFSGFSREISEFAQFLLDRSDFQGVPPDRVKKQNFNRADLQKLEDLATQLGTRRPRDRASYYLSAAKIVSLLEDEDPNLFYKYLCRSYASRGDAMVVESKPLDAARELYCEALSVYDGDRSQSRDEQDAVNALVRFLLSNLGQTQIPITPNIPSIDETLEKILAQHPDRGKVFASISYIVFRSRYAANRVLNRLYNKLSLQTMALEYLKSNGISIASPKRLDDFVKMWNELIRKKLDENRFVSNEFRFLAKLELTTASLEDGVERVKRLASQLFFDLDQQRTVQLQRILETALELCKQTTFEEQERLCFQIDGRCQDLLGETESSPSKLSVEEIYLVVEMVQKKIKVKIEELYESSIPQLTLRLPVESYTLTSDRRIEAQVVVKNRVGCSPAESLELVIPEYENTSVVKLDGSLRGGDQHILKIPIQVSDEAFSSRAFSLPIYAQYRTRSGDIEQTSVNNFSIRLDSEQEFEEIKNPYATYAEGGIVGDSAMFYGREELVANVAKAIRGSRTQSKCVVIYGQKRAGKSSILHHLKAKLLGDNDLLVLDLGNIGSILDEHSAYPFLYQILWGILNKLQYAIEDKAGYDHNSFSLSFPSDKEFYNHPSPLVLFKDVFERFRRSASKSQDWSNVRPILLIDEFSYIHGYIAKGMIPETFMKNWKALLQENYFNAVLVGQDVMPKFKQRFANEFGTTQDERVTYLRREDAIKLIDEPIRIGGLQGESRYRERAIDRIIDLTAGSPFYIQILCNRLTEYMNRKRASLVTEADVEQVKDDLIRGVNALGPDKFDNLINAGDTSEDAINDEDALRVATAIAVNSRTGPCSRHSISCETQKPLDEILDDLVKREVAELERDQYYSIRVGLFKEWLITHQ